MGSPERAERVLAAIRAGDTRRARDLLRGCPVTTVCANGKSLFENMIDVCRGIHGWWVRTELILAPAVKTALAPDELLAMASVALRCESNEALFLIFSGVDRLAPVLRGSGGLLLAYLLWEPRRRDPSVAQKMLSRVPDDEVTEEMMLKVIEAFPRSTPLVEMAALKPPVAATPAVVSAAMAALDAVARTAPYNMSNEAQDVADRILEERPDVRPTLEDVRLMISTRTQHPVFYVYASRYDGVVPDAVVDEAIANGAKGVLAVLANACTQPIVPKLLQHSHAFVYVAAVLAFARTLADDDLALILAALREKPADHMADNVRCGLKAFFGVDADGERGPRLVELIKMIETMPDRQAYIVVHQWFRRSKRRPSPAAIGAGRAVLRRLDLRHSDRVALIRQRLFGTWRLREHALHKASLRNRVRAVMMVAARLRDGAPVGGRPMVAESLSVATKRRKRHMAARVVEANARGLVPPLPTELWLAILECLPGEPLKRAFEIVA